jgi:long-chain acyl-CoA synthetase
MSSKFEPRYNDLVSLFNDSLSRNASRPLFGTKTDGQWNWITYGDFGRIVDQARAGLAQLGLSKGDRAAVISNNRVEWAASAYATYGIGGAFVPMYEAQQPKEWKFILNDSSAKVVFVSSPEIAKKVNEFRSEVPSLKHVVVYDAPASDPNSWATFLANGAKSPRPAEIPDSKLIAAFIYTSGTTGNPKGVLLSHANVANNVSSVLSLLPVVSEDRTLSFLPWAHSFGQTAELHLMIAVGVSMGICEGVDKILPNLAEVKPTVLLAVPRIFNRIYDNVQKTIAAKPAPIQAIFRNGMSAQSKINKGQTPTLGEKLSLPLAKKLVFSKIIDRFGGRLRFAVSGGAALSKEVAEFIDNLGIMVFEGYGLSETSPIASVNSPGGRRIGSVGKAVPGVWVKLLDDEGRDVSGKPGAEGEIVIFGHNVMQGYHNLPEESEKVFTMDGETRGFKSGDLGKFDNDGFLFISGRVKELYKLENGKYVAPAALEEKLQLSPYIGQVMCHGANRPYNVAVIVPKLDNLKEWAQAQGMDANNMQAVVTNPKTKALIRGEIDKFGSEFKGFEGVRDFIVVAEEFSVQNDLLTPKMSMKRRNIVARYGKDLEALYASGSGDARKAAAG